MGVDITIISNYDKQMLENATTDDVNIRYVKRLNSVFGWSKEVLLILEEENPDSVIVLLGVTNFLKMNFKIDKPAIGILTSPLYSLRDITNLGLNEIIRHFRYLLIHIIGAITPRFLIRRRINSLEHIVVLSQANKKRLEDCGVSSGRVKVIPPGIDESDLELPEKREVNEFRKRVSPKGVPVVLYFGSPLTLRGPDTLIKAFTEVCRNFPSKLIILSRLEHKELIEDENVLKDSTRKNGIMDSVEIISSFLERKELRKYLSVADVICLPFKLVISDVPITVLEAMAVGKPTISTNIDGITELLSERGLIVKPCSFDDLAKSIMVVLANSELAKKLGSSARSFMLNYPRWNQIGESFSRLMAEFSEREELWQRHL